MANKQQIYKNLTCLFFCLVVFFVTTIFVSETYYNQIINEQIQEVSVLKSINFQDWALMQAPSSVIHEFKPYAYDQEGKPSLFNQSFKYQYTYEYKNVSFTQGNTGNIRYLNNWKRQLIVDQEQTQKKSDHKIRVLNVDAQTVYNYDYYAPDIRRFALGYNILSSTLSQDFIFDFYGLYITEYMFNNFTMVQSRVFSPLKLQRQQSQLIYNHPVYGLGNPNTLSLWIQMGDQIEDQSFYTSKFYKGVRQQLKLTESQVLYIAGERSTLRGLYMAVKGALYYKLQVLNIDFCQGGYCTIQQLVAAQITQGLLTKDNIFSNTKIDKFANQLNSSLFDTIQYSAFCQKRTDLVCGDPQDAANFFAKNYLSKYSQVAYIFKNLDNPQAIQIQYDLKNAGAAMVQYVKHLYNNVFNIPAKQSTSQKQSQNMKVQAFKRSFTNYNHIQSILDRFKELVYIELHTRAFFNKFIDSDKKAKCEDYYSGDFQEMKQDCEKLPMNTSSEIRVYMEAYLGVNGGKLTNETTMSPSLVYEFMHNPLKSRFAQQAIQLEQDLMEHYSCPSNTCDQQWLMVKQWKEGSVLENLPVKYFGNQTRHSILTWDEQNILNGIQPQLFKFLAVSQQLEAGVILNSNTGVYSLFNLMKVYSDPDGQTYKGIPNRDLLYYVQGLVLEVQFNGMYMNKSPKQFFSEYKSQIIERKRSMGDTSGGASWLNPYISIMKLENKPQKFNYINSGIYSSQKLRSLSLIQDNLYSCSDYQVFKSDTQDVTFLYQSDKKVKGSNLFGFQTKIKQYDTIQGYFEMIYQSQALSYQNTETWRTSKDEDVEAFRYVFGTSKTFPVTVQELTNRTIQLSSDSYFIIQPQTGLTLQMYIKYIVYSKPFYIQYIQRNATSNLPLYEGQIYFRNDNTDKIVMINQDKSMLSLLFLMGIVVSSISMVGLVLMLALYRRAFRTAKPTEQKKSLLDSEVQSESTVT